MMYQHIKSPLGKLTLVADEKALKEIFWSGEALQPVAGVMPKAGENAVLAQAATELNAYFNGLLTAFTVPVAPEGTAFQQAAWQALCAIPYGETRSYAQQAQAINKPKAVRAIGAANGRNPIPVIIPCHRVIGSDGSLTGYAGGLAIKTYLLELEQEVLSHA